MSLLRGYSNRLASLTHPSAPQQNCRFSLKIKQKTAIFSKYTEGVKVMKQYQNP